MFTGKFVEQVLRFFTQHVDQYVQTTAVRHAQHHFAGAALTRVADNLFEHRDQRIAAFQREAFCAREFRPEVAFEAFRRGQLAQEAFFSSALKLALPATDSIRCWIQRFSSVEVMCIYSAPMEPQ